MLFVNLCGKKDLMINGNICNVIYVLILINGLCFSGFKNLYIHLHDFVYRVKSGVDKLAEYNLIATNFEQLNR